MSWFITANQLFVKGSSPAEVPGGSRGLLLLARLSLGCEIAQLVQCVAPELMMITKHGTVGDLVVVQY